MKFSGCVSYCKDTCHYHESIATVYNVLNKLEGIMTAFKYQRALLLKNQFISYGLIKQLAYP